MAEQETLGEYEKKLFETISKAEEGNSSFSYLKPIDVLKKSFGYNCFKPQQLEIINRVLNKEGHTLGIMPTGGGKSLCFQIPALIQKNLTLIVSPLIALMKDQTDSLTKKNIPAAFFINSLMPEEARERILGLVEKGKVNLLYLAPESLKSEKVLDVLKKIDVGLFVIDEAHCISTWGHNFRPDYLRLPFIIRKLNRPLIMALTATATKEVEEDIQKQLKIHCKVFKASFDRPNLYLDVIKVGQTVKKELFLVNLLKKLDGQTIIFASYQKTTEKLSGILNKAGIKSAYYHAGLDRDEREKRQNQFISGACGVIVATIAFGMGIDKSDIRNIIHYNMSQSVESYYQEIGRAGRDGKASNCITLLTKSDEYRIKKLISCSWPDEEKIKGIISYLQSRKSYHLFTTSRKVSLDCDVGEIPANLILQRLEEFGAIKVYANVLYELKPLFNKSCLEIIRENPDYMEELGRIFSCDFFRESRRKWLALEDVMLRTGLKYFRILEILRHLKDKGYLKFQEEKRKTLIVVKDKISDFDAAPLVSLFESLLEHDLKKVDLLVENLTVPGCIRKNILGYFDEPGLKEDCKMCSYCVGEKLASGIKLEIDDGYAAEEDIERLCSLGLDPDNNALLVTLLKCVARDSDMPVKDIVRILAGSLRRTSSRWKFKLCSYGVFGRFKDDTSVLERNLQAALANGLVKEGIDGTLRITRKGIGYVLNS